MQDDEQLKFDEELSRCVQASPFEPFVIVLNSGDRVPVNDGDYVAVGETVVSVVGEEAGQWVIRKSQLVAVVVQSTAIN